MGTGAIFLLAAAVFGASVLQAATGIGYGVIAGPVFLIILNGSEAFQISAAHNFLIAAMLTPYVFRRLDPSALKFLIAGAIMGIPLGFVVQLVVSVAVLKSVSIVAVGFVAITLVINMRNGTKKSGHGKPTDAETTIVGVAAGIMGGMLAMPGPLAATWMSIRGWNKQSVRATVLSFFVFAYGSTLVLYALFSDVTAKTVWLTLYLSPAVIGGIVVGNRIARLVSERTFRQLLLVVLIATVASLLVSLIGGAR